MALRLMMQPSSALDRLIASRTVRIVPRTLML